MLTASWSISHSVSERRETKAPMTGKNIWRLCKEYGRLLGCPEHPSTCPRSSNGRGPERKVRAASRQVLGSPDGISIRVSGTTTFSPILLVSCEAAEPLQRVPELDTQREVHTDGPRPSETKGTPPETVRHIFEGAEKKTQDPKIVEQHKKVQRGGRT